MNMKVLLTSFIFLTCIIGNAQQALNKKKKDTTNSTPPFAWFAERQLPTIPNRIVEIAPQALAEILVTQPSVKKKNGMPIYPTPSSENYLMPVKTVDTTKTKYLKIYPTRD
jgi:hypothetical protein